MNTSVRQNLEADGPNSQRGCPLPPRERVLEVSCRMFAEAGFHGTHFREICKRTGTNVAGICYHFQSKEGLYKAVLMEAGRSFSEIDDSFAVSRNLPPEQKLLRLTESLLERVGAKGAWTAKLLARELVDPGCGAHTYVASGLERYFVLLQAVLRQLLGGESKEAIRFHALSLIAETVFYCLAGENPEYPLIQMATPCLDRALLARLITQRSLGSLDNVSARNQSETFS